MDEKVKKVLKWSGRILIGLVLFLILAAFLTLIFLDQIAKSAVEKLGPVVLGVPVTVERLSIKPFRGRVEIDNLIVGNPANRGYQSPHAVKLGDIDIEIDIFSLGSEKIRMHEVSLKDVEINYEADLQFSKSNIDDIRTNAENFTKKLQGEKAETTGDAETPARTEPAETAGDAETPARTEPAENAKTSGEEQTASANAQKKIQIDLLQVKKVGLTVYIPATGTGVPVKLTLEPIRDLGANDDGVTVSEASLAVLNALNAATLNAIREDMSVAGSKLSDFSMDALNKTLDSVSAGLNALTESKAVQEGADAVQKGADAVQKGADAVKGLLDFSSGREKK